jgi:hypothetical protein
VTRPLPSSFYTIARNGKWWFGQYALFVPSDDLAPLLQQARDEETLLNDLHIRKKPEEQPGAGSNARRPDERFPAKHGRS